MSITQVIVLQLLCTLLSGRGEKQPQQQELSPQMFFLLRHVCMNESRDQGSHDFSKFPSILQKKCSTIVIHCCSIILQVIAGSTKSRMLLLLLLPLLPLLPLLLLLLLLAALTVCEILFGAGWFFVPRSLSSLVTRDSSRKGKQPSVGTVSIHFGKGVDDDDADDDDANEDAGTILFNILRQ
jgi:hypothetical protein